MAKSIPKWLLASCGILVSPSCFGKGIFHYGALVSDHCQEKVQFIFRVSVIFDGWGCHATLGGSYEIPNGAMMTLSISLSL